VCRSDAVLQINVTAAMVALGATAMHALDAHRDRVAAAAASLKARRESAHATARSASLTHQPRASTAAASLNALARVPAYLIRNDTGGDVWYWLSSSNAAPQVLCYVVRCHRDLDR
jgi:hypothetical protein